MYVIKGKIDTTNAHEFEKDIMQALPTEIDAAELEYISSAGLRVLMKLRKTVGEVTVINVNSEVYGVFDVTGFTSILNVKRAIRELDITGKEIIGKGGNGTVYRLDEERIVKVYNPDYALERIEKEQQYAKSAFVSGVPSVIAYDVVKVGDSYGVIFEAMNSDTLGHAISADPEHIDDYVGKYVEFAKTIHTTKIIGNEIASLKDLLRSRVSSDDMRLYCQQEDIDVLLDIIDSMADSETLVHGDLHPGNIMIQNGELMLIDMAEVTKGVAIYDVASVFRDLIQGPQASPETTELSTGLKPELAIKVGNQFLMRYSGAQSAEQFEGYMKMLGLVYAFNVACFIPDIPDRRDMFAPQIVQNLIKPVIIPNADKLKFILSK